MPPWYTHSFWTEAFCSILNWEYYYAHPYPSTRLVHLLMQVQHPLPTPQKYSEGLVTCKTISWTSFVYSYSRYLCDSWVTSRWKECSSSTTSWTPFISILTIHRYFSTVPGHALYKNMLGDAFLCHCEGRLQFGWKGAVLEEVGSGTFHLHSELGYIQLPGSIEAPCCLLLDHLIFRLVLCVSCAIFFSFLIFL